MRFPVKFNSIFKKNHHFTHSFKNSAGRNCRGRIVMRTRGKIIKKTKKLVWNKVNTLPLNTIISFNTVNQNFFTLAKAANGLLFYRKTIAPNPRIFGHSFFKYGNTLPSTANTISYIDKLNPKTPICLISKTRFADILFTRANFTNSYIVIKNRTKVTALVKLASGVKKLLSLFATAQQTGRFFKNQSDVKINFKNLRRLGFKSTVRGVAMNPVDHPHGGRTKTIRYPRTPWGRTTKFK